MWRNSVKPCFSGGVLEKTKQYFIWADIDHYRPSCEWMESIIVTIHKKGDKTDCNNYRGIPILPTTYKILSHILLSRLIPYAKEIIGDPPCGIRSNRSTTDHIFCIRQVLEKKWENNEEVYQLFIDVKRAIDSVRREILYKILIEFGINRKLVTLIKMSLTETYGRVRVGKNVSDRFPIMNVLIKGRRSITNAFQHCFRVRH